MHQNLVMVIVLSGLEMNPFWVCFEAKIHVFTFLSLFGEHVMTGFRAWLIGE